MSYLNVLKRLRCIPAAGARAAGMSAADVSRLSSSPPLSFSLLSSPLRPSPLPSSPLPSSPLRSFGMSALPRREEEETGTGSGKPRERDRTWLEPVNMNPSEVVEALSEHIIGQHDAKKAIAIALRNRWRRMKLPSDQQDEIIPKNILMVGPTGCGKTEIARRLAKLCKAPFIKVEATKFTEVGYHGRDVDTIIKDLMDASLALVKDLKTDSFKEEVRPLVEQRILEAITGPGATEDTVQSFRELLRSGAMEDREIMVELPVKEKQQPTEVDVSVGGNATAVVNLSDFMQQIMPGVRGKQPLQRKTVKVKDARAVLTEAEIEKKLNSVDLRREAVTLAEQNGIVVIDEIDKIVSNKSRHSADASSEGVQRDLLPLIEGTSIEVRRFGNVKTDYILFIACGAFHEHKPSDLLAELQGRLPIRVELKGLDAKDLERILTEPKFNLLAQQSALLAAENIDVVFDPEAVKEIAKLAADINRTVENIGARRLHTVIEKIMEDISFNAPALAKQGGKVVVDKETVRQKLLPMLQKTDLSKFIL